jgi:phage terminase Nu1 subunit (DNA packaging protein)
MSIDLQSIRSIVNHIPGERTRTLILLLCEEIERLRKELERAQEQVKR